MMLGVAHFSSFHASAHGTHDALMQQANEELAAEPTSGGKWYKRALIQFDHEDWAESLSDLEEAEKLAAGAFPVLWMRGQILEKQGDHTQAKGRFDEFLTDHPHHWGALMSRARVAAKLGLQDQAITDYRSALANNPKPEPDFYSEIAAELAAHGDTDEALAVLQQGASRLGEIPSLQMAALHVEVDAERWDPALQRVEKIQQSATRPEPWMMKRGSILASAGRLAESRSAWQALLTHLRALPVAERESHSMCLIAEQAQLSLRVLSNSVATATQP